MPTPQLLQGPVAGLSQKQVQRKFSNNMNMSDFFRIAEKKNPRKRLTLGDVLPELRI